MILYYFVIKESLLNKIQKVIIILFVFIIVILFFSVSNSSKVTKEMDYVKYVELSNNHQVLKAKVLEIASDETVTEDFYGINQPVRTILFNAVFLEGDLRGTSVNGRQVLNSMDTYGHYNPVAAGNIVFLYPSFADSGEAVAEFSEYYRINQLILFAVFFGAVLFLYSGSKGLRSLLALGITCLVIFFIFLPLIINGHSPIFSALLACLLITFLTLVIVCGFSTKMLSSLIGCFSGIVVAGILAFIMQKVMNLTGLTDEHARMLFMDNAFNMNGIIFAAIIIGALGATMDVSVSIASSLEEIIVHSKNTLDKGSIINSGMNIGGDIMGTMTNTLVLAYVGSALPLIILMALNVQQLAYAISWELISTEILRSLAGSIGMICVVPATSIATALLHHNVQFKKKDKRY